MKSREEHILISKVVTYDDHKAFEKLMLLHQNAIKNFLLKLLDFNEGKLDDLFQETCTKIYSNIKKFRGESAFSTWAFKIAYNTFLNAKKRTDKFQSFKDKFLISEKSENPAFGHDRKMDIERMISVLKPQEKAAIQLSYIQGLSHKDIAHVLDCPIGTVKSLIKRSKEKIAKSFNLYK